MNSVIKVENLTKEFKVKKTSGKIIKDLFYPDRIAVKAVDNISFNINEGESVAFLGPNGAGKTTTTKMLAGLLYPTSGKVSVLGYEPFKRDKRLMRQIGLVMGNKSGLNWDLTPTQSFELLRDIYRIDHDECADTLASLVDMLEVSHVMDKQVRRLSLGERMKVEMIGAILHKPKVLYLDEPTIGLDITTREKVRSFLRTIQSDHKTTLLLTSHDMDDIEHVSDRVIIINEGKLVTDENIEQIHSKYSQDKFLKIYTADKDAVRDILNEVEIVEEKSSQLLIKGDKKHVTGLIPHLMELENVRDIDLVSVPLENIIKDIFKGR